MLRDNPAVLLVSRAWRHAGAHRPLMALYVALFFAAQLVSLAEPYVVGRLLDAVQSARDRAALVAAVGHGALLFAGVHLLHWLLHGPARVIEKVCAFHVRAGYRATLFDRAMELPLGWHREHHSGDTIDRMSRASTALHEFAGNSFSLINMGLRFLGAIAVLTWFMPAAGLAALATSAALAALIFAFDRTLAHQYSDLNRHEHRAAIAIQDYLTNAVTVLTLRLGGRVGGEVRRRVRAAADLLRANVTINELKWFATNQVMVWMTAAVLYGYAVGGEGALKVGAFFTLLEYLRRIGDCSFNFAAFYGTLVRQAADVRGADTVEDAHRALAEPAKAAALPAGWQRLEVRGVDFAYRDARGARRHLEDAGVTLERGRAVALVGHSGSGKSTFLSLLRGLQPPAAGAVFADGRPVPAGLTALAGVTTLMPQDPEIFSDTVRFNITFGLDAAPHEIDEAVRLAGFEPVLARLPDGLDTHLVEKGASLSGGEKQRLALARGAFFARTSPIVLLDEPTSSVDAKSERTIYSRMLEAYRGRCVVSSIHRLHLLPLFDRIVVLDGGRVVESGNFFELIARGGALASMWKSYQDVTHDEAAVPVVVEAAI